MSFITERPSMTVEEIIKHSENTWAIAYAAIEHADKVLLYGPPGTGKTTAGMLHCAPEHVAKVTMHEEMPAAELQGFYMPGEDGKFEWGDGIGIDMWRKGGRIVLDEIDRASGDAQTVCYAILDDPEVARLTLPTKETVAPEAGFQVVATMNGHPNDLPAALRDRFDVTVQIDLPHPMVVESLAPEIREVARNDIFSPRREKSSVREWKAFDKIRKRSSDEEQVARMVFNGTGDAIVRALKLSSI